MTRPLDPKIKTKNHIERRRRAEDKLWDRCIPEPNTGCWLWVGPLYSSGYGEGSFYGIRRMHRAAWQIANRRPVPSGLHVLHRCDVRCCINPSHLFLGTHEENMADASRKNRWGHRDRVPPDTRARGERNGSSKLTEKDVRTILALKNKGLVGREVAAMFGIHKASVWNIWRGNGWVHIKGSGKSAIYERLDDVI